MMLGREGEGMGRRFIGSVGGDVKGLHKGGKVLKGYCE